MNRKKILTGGVACALLIGLLAIPASAHGGRHHSGAGAAGYAVCTVGVASRPAATATTV